MTSLFAKRTATS